MEIKQAFSLLKKNRGQPLRFWYCAAGADGEPILLMDKKNISAAERKALMKTAVKKQFCSGALALSGGDALEVTPNGGVPSEFDRKVKKIAKSCNVVVQDVVVKEAVAESEDEPDELASQPLGQQYVGEDQRAGWRADMLKPGISTADREAFRQGDKVTTKYFDESEKRASGVQVGADGLLRDGSGQILSGEKGFVVDPTTGQAHVFDGKVETLPDGKKRAVHHSSPLAGGAVAGAGHLKIEGGRVEGIDDASGHYKPGPKLTFQTVKRLEAIAAKLVDDSLKEIGQDGVVRDATAESKKHYEVVRLYEQWRTEQGDQAGPYSEDIGKLKQALLEKGVGPANSPARVTLQGKYGFTMEEFALVRGDQYKMNAKLEEKYGFKDLLSGLSNAALDSHAQINLEIGERTKLILTKDQYLQTQGNEGQARKKVQLNDEVLRSSKTVAGKERVEEEKRRAEAESKVQQLIDARLAQLGKNTEVDALLDMGLTQYMIDSYLQRDARIRLLLGKLDPEEWKNLNGFAGQ